MRRLIVLVATLLCVRLCDSGHALSLDPSDTTLTPPVIENPDQPSESDQQELTRIATIFASAPSSADNPPVNTDQEDDLANILLGAGGTATQGATGAESNDASEANTNSAAGSTGTANQANIQKEIQLLTTLISHGQAIAQALPAKEQRLAELKAQLNAALGQQAQDGANAQLQEQEQLLTAIQAKITQLKQKLEDLETTETKLEASIAKVKQAVSNNEQVTHQLNQAAAKASVEAPGSTGANSGGAAAGTSAAGTASFLEEVVDS